MPTLERLSKSSKPRLKRAHQSSSYGQSDISSNSSTLIHLQRTIGNHAVQQMLNPPQSEAIGHLPFDIDHHSPLATIQRQIAPLEGKSSGFFKGRRDKINDMVNAYNLLEKQASSKGLSENHKALLPHIQKIWLAARAWYVDVVKSNPEKAKAIDNWMKTQVEREEDVKVALIGKLHDAETLKAAWDGAAYNQAYTTDEFTTASTAGEKWLKTPALAPIYKYFIIEVQHDSVTLDAYEDLKRYRANPSRSEAIRIYKKYNMATADQLNITGEGVGGTQAINLVRQQMEALESNPNSALPANFGAIESSIETVINEIFISFRNSQPYKRITTAPQ